VRLIFVTQHLEGVGGGDGHVCEESQRRVPGQQSELPSSLPWQISPSFILDIQIENHIDSTR